MTTAVRDAHERTIAEKFSIITNELNERSRRMWVATEAHALGYGGVRIVHRATGMDTKTIRAGIQEIRNPDMRAPQGKIRRPGGGRKKCTDTDPSLGEAIEACIEPHERGDPESPLRWTTKSAEHIRNALVGHTASPMTILRYLRGHDYALQSNRKRHEGTDHPDRDLQFRYINKTVLAAQKHNQPCISVDTKKKENVGNYKNGGQEWHATGEPVEVNMHDFPDKELGKAIPYGVYDLAHNNGYVSIGITSDTAAFAVHSIATWWRYMGKRRYPDATDLTVTADSGGSNSARSRLWKVELQTFANKTGLTIHVRHFPPGTSKWNKIEHRLFAMITKNWRGRPLDSLATVVNLIGNTKTDTGLTVKAVLDTRTYNTGIKVSDEELAKVNLIRDEFHGEWNYTIAPSVGY